MGGGVRRLTLYLIFALQYHRCLGAAAAAHLWAAIVTIIISALFIILAVRLSSLDSNRKTSIHQAIIMNVVQAELG